MNTELGALDFLVVMPEIFLMAMVLLILLVEVFSKKSNQPLLFGLSLVALAGTALLSIYQYNLELGEGAPLLAGEAELNTLTFWYGDVAHSKTISFVKFSMSVVVLMGLIYSYQRLKDEMLDRAEFYILTLLSTLGMLVMVASASMLTLYLGLELMSLPMYGLVALNRHSSRSTEAAMKYFVMGAMASGILLFGIALIYGATGSIEFNVIAQQLIEFAQGENAALSTKLLVFASVFIVVGVVFKVGAAPFHAWVPDVYEGAPIPVAMFVGAAPKIAALVMGALLLLNAFANIAEQWQMMLSMIAIISFVLGNLVALRQENLRRMLGYSAVSHGGFILLGLFVDKHGYSSGLFYAITYALTTIAAFGFILLIKNHDRAVENISELKGFAKENPWLALLMSAVMLSMGGIPFLVGFQAKFLVLMSAFHAGYTYLVIIGLVMSVIGLYYYLRIIKVMFFDEADEGSSLKVTGCNGTQILFSVNVLLLILLGIYPNALLSFIF